MLRLRQTQMRVAATLLLSRRWQATAPQGAQDFSHVTKNMVWGLWNEGNLFSLSVPELGAFLRSHCNVEVDPAAKKSALVRQVEEVMSAEQPSLTVEAEDTVANITANEYRTQGGDLFEEADVYGDWGAEPGFEGRKELDFMELSPSKMGLGYDPLSPRAFQLLHDHCASDVGLSVVNPSKLPGHKEIREAFVAVPVTAYDTNKVRFRRAFKWCAANLWNMNMQGEINIGAGKALYWRQAAKYNRNILPIWTCQQHLYNAHPYTWFAVAHESNVAAIEALAAKLGMGLTQEPVTSYKVTIKRSRDQFDCELNAQLQCTQLNKAWDRFLVTHYLRNNMPDLRMLVRARHPIKKRIADAFFETDILRMTRDSVQSVLTPELGDVTYCCERVVRKWSSTLPCGVKLQLVETKRTPLIVTIQGEEGERLEYEYIVQIPQQAENIDLQRLSDELWDYGNEFAKVLEDGMQELAAHTMPSSAAFDPVTPSQA